MLSIIQEIFPRRAHGPQSQDGQELKIKASKVPAKMVEGKEDKNHILSLAPLRSRLGRWRGVALGFTDESGLCGGGKRREEVFLLICLSPKSFLFTEE